MFYLYPSFTLKIVNIGLTCHNRHNAKLNASPNTDMKEMSNLPKEMLLWKPHNISLRNTSNMTCITYKHSFLSVFISTSRPCGTVILNNIHHVYALCEGIIIFSCELSFKQVNTEISVEPLASKCDSSSKISTYLKRTKRDRNIL